MSTLRDKVIHLAFHNPEFRKDLLPLVTASTNTILRAWAKDSAKNKAWLARIDGVNRQYGLSRDFIEPHRDHYGHKGSGSYGREWDSAALPDGIYQDSELDLMSIRNGAITWLKMSAKAVEKLISEVGIEAAEREVK